MECEEEPEFNKVQMIGFILFIFVGAYYGSQVPMMNYIEGFVIMAQALWFVPIFALVFYYQRM